MRYAGERPDASHSVHGRLRAWDRVSQTIDFLIPEYARSTPLRLADTYTGLILKRSGIVALLEMRRDYRAKLEDVVREAEHLATPMDSESPQRPKLIHLHNFIAEYLAFAMFSHRWRGREPTLDDVRGATHGIYPMDNKDLVEKNLNVCRLPRSKLSKASTGVEKLQEFCCLAAECGFRWAWSDTCRINKNDYAETSESINCMFLWYRSSDLTIVYLDDVDEVKEGRLPAVGEEGGKRWFEDPELRRPLPPTDPSVPQTSSDTYDTTLQTESYLSLHDRLQDRTSPQLRSMKPDAQVERPHLETHLMDTFPSVQDCKIQGKYRKLPIWVSRGWTLQEMIASKRLRFYSKRWTLLEEADDRDTDEAEQNISISSFRYRARLVDHRANDLWGNALVNTTGVPLADLTNFKVGTRDVRSRLLWAARRTTTKVEDMAYCLLGIFDISLPAMYGEGFRAFFRLQEELMKRTGDMSLFDWCGRSSSVNSFLWYNPECFIERSLPHSIFRTIGNVLRMMFGTAWSGIKAVVSEAVDFIRQIMRSTPPGHTLVNGELNISLFEHQVRHCERLENSTLGHPYYHYKLEVHGLVPTMVTCTSQVSSLMNNPTQYYLCRVWNRHTHNVFQILLEFIEYILRDTWKEMWSNDSDSDSGRCSRKWQL